MGKNAFFEFLVLFWAYIGQPDNNIGWATLLSFESIYPTHPRTNPWHVCEKIIKIGGVENLFWSRPLRFFVCFIPVQINLWGTKDGTKFWWLPWFPEIVFCCIAAWIQPDISGCQQDFLVVWRWNQLRTF